MTGTREMAGSRDVRVQVRVVGAVPAELPDLARRKVETALRHVGEPVLAARVLLAIAPDPAVARPAIASGTVSVNGRIVRAEVVADTMRNAIDQLACRLRVRLERAAPGQRDYGPDKRRHRPGRVAAKAAAGERSVIREASVAGAPKTPATAARELGLLGCDFYLFTDELSGQDSVIYRTADGYKIDSVRPFGVVSAVPTADVTPASRISISEHAAPRLSVADAISRLEYLGESFVFFADAATGRGSVLYRRIDGRYGLVVPADAVRQLLADSAEGF
jgi:ribosome-associated translation inhibitor RaiA